MPSRIEGRSRRRRRRILPILAMSALLWAGWKASPRIDYEVHLFLAGRAIDADRLEEAENRLDLLLIEHPMKTWPKFLKAKLARKRGQITEAEEILQRAIELGLPVGQARAEHDLLR